MKSNAKPKVLRRYTDLPGLITLLNRRAITLLDPVSWDDTNDSYFMNCYKNAGAFTTVLALCFTEANERYHFWRAFSHGPSGVCIEFDRMAIERAVEAQPDATIARVNYLTLTTIKTLDLKANVLPFTKRFGYEQEKEIRILYSTSKMGCESIDIPIRLTSIRKIRLSPWMHQSLFNYVKSSLKSINGCESLKIEKSTLIDNEKWKARGKEAK